MLTRGASLPLPLLSSLIAGFLPFRFGILRDPLGPSSSLSRTGALLMGTPSAWRSTPIPSYSRSA